MSERDESPLWLRCFQEWAADLTEEQRRELFCDLAGELGEKVRGAVDLRNPLDLICEAFEVVFPGKKVTVRYEPFVEEFLQQVAGYTRFEEGKDPHIGLRVELDIVSACETLCHELAHAAVGLKAQHGPEWEAAYEAIYSEYQRLGDSRELEFVECEVTQ